jgi:hypothetical protein
LQPGGESGRHLGHVGRGHLVVVILGKGGGAAEGRARGRWQKLFIMILQVVCSHWPKLRAAIISDMDEHQYDDDLEDELQFNRKSCSLTSEA